jgi:magnesium-transporting ATPase (P-type)
MITGDIKETAEAIACKVGITEDNADLSQRSFTGKEFF